ncbi:MAG: hypothetical protein K0R33_1912 [Mycobacterium sp.]|nr:hypothetical protein [Mycobacterium sp.]
MSAPTASVFAVTDDELALIGSGIGVTDFPVVLAIRPRHSDTTTLRHAQEHARQCLVRRGLMGAEGDPHPDLADAVHALRRPARELAVRLVTPDGNARVSVARSACTTVSVRRVRNELQLKLITDTHDRSAMIRAVLAELPSAPAAATEAFGAPARDLASALDGGHAARYLTDRLRALGASQRTALALGTAFAARTAFAEIVCHALDPVADRVVRGPGAVGVFYTARGRVVSAPSVSPSGQLWSTLKSGTDHRLAQAVSQLTELVPGGWEGDTQ